MVKAMTLKFDESSFLNNFEVSAFKFPAKAMTAVKTTELQEM